MTLPLVIIRPQPGAWSTARLFGDAGFDVHAHPLFTVEPVVDGAPPSPSSYDALLIGSANALRHLPDIARFNRLPCYAVGEKSAALARSLGFAVAATGTGGLAQLLPDLVRDGRRAVLRLAGEDHVVLEPPPEMRIDTYIVYRSVALPLPPGLAGLLRRDCIILLHSSRAAQHLADECDRLEIDRARHRILAFAAPVTEAAGSGWQSVQCAENPDDQALLALARQLCQKAADGP